MQTTISGKEVLFVAITTDATTAYVHRDNKGAALVFGTPQGDYGFSYQDLPNDSWQFLFMTHSATEEAAKKAVHDQVVGMYTDYTIEAEFGRKVRFDSALESLQSLILSLGLDINKNYAVLIKK